MRRPVSLIIRALKAARFTARQGAHLPDTLRDQRLSSYGRAVTVPDSAAAPAGKAHPFAIPDGALDPAYHTQIMALAELYKQHRFDLLGSGWVQVRHGMDCRGVEGWRYPPASPVQVDTSGAWLADRINAANVTEARRIWQLIDPGYVPIDWQLDFKSGWRWSEKTPYLAIRYGHMPGVDIKLPWELARMQHLPQFAYASALNRDPAWAREFRNQTLDFIATNPPRFGVNWSGTMDVAIRVANWLVTFDLFRATGARFDAAFECEFQRSVYAHGAHIRANLEWRPGWRGNHYLAALAGLLFAAASLPPSPRTREWDDFAAHRFIRETALQFNPDGSTREGSTAYHRLTAEIVFYTTALLLRRGDPIPAEHLARLPNIAAFTRDIAKPNGHIPQFGDNDNGRFLKLTVPYQRRTTAEAKARYANLTEYADLPDDAVYWDEDHLDQRAVYEMLPKLVGITLDPTPGTTPPPLTRKAIYRFTERTLAETAGKTVYQFEAPSPDLRDGLNRIAYPDFGLYVYRSPRLYLAIRCGAIGQDGRGGHAHNDQLAVELMLDGVTRLEDSGTYLYTALADRRNQYRSAQVHNGPRIAGHEPGRLDLGLFRLGNAAQAECILFDENVFIGTHRGYAVSVYRRVTIHAASVTLEDFAEGAAIPLQSPVNIAYSPGYGSQFHRSERVES